MALVQPMRHGAPEAFVTQASPITQLMSHAAGEATVLNVIMALAIILLSARLWWLERQPPPQAQPKAPEEPPPLSDSSDDEPPLLPAPEPPQARPVRPGLVPGGMTSVFQPLLRPASVSLLRTKLYRPHHAKQRSQSRQRGRRA